MSKQEVAKKPGRQPSEGPTIASVAMAAIKEGLDNKAVLEAVKKQFPDSKTAMASINWYRNKAREEDPSILTSREINKRANAVKKAEKKAAADKAKAEKKAAADKAKADKKPAKPAAKSGKSAAKKPTVAKDDPLG